MFLLACHGGAASTPDGGGGTGSDGGGETPASGWSHETLINHPPSFIDYDLSASAVGINASGIAVALWREQPMPSGMSLLWANVYRAGVWGTPLAIADPGSSEGAVSVLPNGDGVGGQAALANGSPSPDPRVNPDGPVQAVARSEGKIGQAPT